jgi:hypothetical protein
MWTTVRNRKDRRLRNALLITSHQGRERVGVGEGQAGGEGSGAGKIVIVGWSGEPFAAPRQTRTNATNRPAATEGSRNLEGTTC